MLQDLLLLRFHRPSPNAIKEICYHHDARARKDQMDTVSVDALNCVCMCGGGHGGREREEMVPAPGFMCVRPLTPDAWFFQSVSHVTRSW